MQTILKKTLAVLGLGFCLLATNAYAALNYWDPTGATNNLSVTAFPGLWEGTNWAPTATLTANLIPFTEGVAADFAAGASGFSPYTVTVGSDHSIAGIFNGLTGTTGSSALSIVGPGILSITAGLQGFSTASGDNTYLYVTLAGTGGVETENSGSIYLYGTNTYTGGTWLSTSAGCNFNNSASFGTGTISNIAGAVLATPAATVTAPITISNNIVTVTGL